MKGVQTYKTLNTAMYYALMLLKMRKPVYDNRCDNKPPEDAMQISVTCRHATRTYNLCRLHSQTSNYTPLSPLSK